jgi:hypothetical protein
MFEQAFILLGCNRPGYGNIEPQLPSLFCRDAPPGGMGLAEQKPMRCL